MASPLVITPGEPAGIGPDLVVRYAQQERQTPVVVLADAELLKARADTLGLPLKVCTDTQTPSLRAGEISVSHVPIAGSYAPGVLDIKNVPGVLAALDQAIAGCTQGNFAGLVTGPMQKSIVNEAGIAFSGHTEYLAEACDAEVVMMLAADNLRVALATTHLPLAAVPAAIQKPALDRTLRIVLHELKAKFKIPSPRLLVAGLNPHAGEAGHLGREEIETTAPVCDALRAEGHNVIGPLPADTLFTPGVLAQADGVLAMYHDQGLPVLKYAGFGHAVNITLGLPFVRTSVDHGTALDIAGTDAADASSFLAAIDAAVQLCG